MNEKQISKISLLLLINEIIKTNIELLKNNKIELISDDDVNDNFEINEKKENEDDLKEIYDHINNTNEIENINISHHINKNQIDVKKYSNRNLTEINIISFKMKQIGINIGKKLVERLLIEKNQINDIKDILKFVGNDIWSIIFNKNADKLQAYKKGKYFIVDNNIDYWLKYLLIDNNTNQKNNFIHYYLILIIGIIKGALNKFNINNYVTYDLNYPQCVFQVNLNEN